MFHPRKIPLERWEHSLEPLAQRSLAEDMPKLGVPVDWQAEVWREGGKLHLHLEAQALLQVECQRCLAQMPLDLAVGRTFLFAQNEEAAAILDAQESHFDVLAWQDRFDLLTLIEDELLLALPFAPTHEECPQPLPGESANLTAAPALPERGEEDSAWSVLAALRAAPRTCPIAEQYLSMAPTPEMHRSALPWSARKLKALLRFQHLGSRDAGASARGLFRGIRSFGALGIMLLGLAARDGWTQAVGPNASGRNGVQVRVTRVVDGDTFWGETQDGKRLKVRILGVDAPETCQSFGREAKDALWGKIGKKMLHLDGVAAKDDYGRVLATPYLQQENIAAWLVQNGYAWNYSAKRSPGAYAGVQSQARGRSLGLWATGEAQDPRRFRYSHGPCPLPDRP